MERDITYSIVYQLIQDMRVRDSTEKSIENVNIRDVAIIQISMYETWRELISQELLRCGMVDEGYIRKRNEDLRAMSFHDLLELRDLYVRYQGEDD